MGYKVIFNYSDGSVDEDLLDEVFDSREEAYSEAAQASSDYTQGNEYLDEAGEEYSSKEIVDWDIVEV